MLDFLKFLHTRSFHYSDKLLKLLRDKNTLFEICVFELYLQTCVEFLGRVVQTQQVVDHGGFADAPRPQEQNHGLRGDLTVCTGCDTDRDTVRRLKKNHKYTLLPFFILACNNNTFLKASQRFGTTAQPSRGRTVLIEPSD